MGEFKLLCGADIGEVGIKTSKGFNWSAYHKHLETCDKCAGRPSGMVTFTLFIRRSQKDAVYSHAKDAGKNMSEVIREAIDLYLESLNEKTTN